MKHILIPLLLAVFLSVACKNGTPTQPVQQQAPAKIVVTVSWQNQGIAEKKIVLVDKAETLYTNQAGQAVFSVPAGHYTIRAFDINRGGPSLQSIDYDVSVSVGRTSVLDITDCLECV